MPAVGIFQQQTHPAHATAEDVEYHPTRTGSSSTKHEYNVASSAHIVNN